MTKNTHQLQGAFNLNSFSHDSTLINHKQGCDADAEPNDDKDNDLLRNINW